MCHYENGLQRFCTNYTQKTTDRDPIAVLTHCRTALCAAGEPFLVKIVEYRAADDRKCMDRRKGREKSKKDGWMDNVNVGFSVLLWMW